VQQGVCKNYGASWYCPEPAHQQWGRLACVVVYGCLALCVAVPGAGHFWSGSAGFCFQKGDLRPRFPAPFIPFKVADPRSPSLVLSCVTTTVAQEKLRASHKWAYLRRAVAGVRSCDEFIT
jgi:hypothetical protein